MTLKDLQDAVGFVTAGVTHRLNTPNEYAVAKADFARVLEELEPTQEIPVIGSGVFRKVDEIHDERIFQEMTK